MAAAEGPAGRRPGSKLDRGLRPVGSGAQAAAGCQSKAVLDETRHQNNSWTDGPERELAGHRDGWAEYNDGLATLDQEERGRPGQELADALTRSWQDGRGRSTPTAWRSTRTARRRRTRRSPTAEAELADARQAQVDDIEDCEWYVLGRDTNSGVVGYSQDAERVGNLANVFPVIFFLVAALACLTTMTRMVEEQRTQIGALKALGFARLAICHKVHRLRLLGQPAGRRGRVWLVGLHPHPRGDRQRLQDHV